MTSVLVTGGAGFIGSHLVAALAARGDEVVVVDVFDPQVHGTRPHVTPPGAGALVVGDVRDAELMTRLVAGADVVVHLAALTGASQSLFATRAYVDTNAGGTATVIDALARRRGDCRLVLASSRAVYGEGAHECPRCGRVHPRLRGAARLAAGRWEPTCPSCDAETRPVPTPEVEHRRPGTIYALTKDTQEQTALLVGAVHGVPVTVLRYFNVYGAGQALGNPYTGVVTAFAARCLAGLPPSVYEDGAETRDLVHVGDVVAATMAAIDRPEAAGEAYNVGTGRPVSLLDIAGLVAAELGAPAPEVSGVYRVGDVRHCHADLQRVTARLGYRPTTALEDGLRGLFDGLAGPQWAELALRAEQELLDLHLAGRST